jgi:uroporphyrinogen-III synthase
MPKPTLILTRPEAQSRALAELFADQADVVISPVMQIIAGGDVPDLARYRGMILTSANAVPFLPDLTGLRIYCVGKRTGEAATEAGGEVELIALDADDLVARLTDPGPLIHLHGEHVRGDVAKRLNSAEIETDSAEIYRQEAMGLTPKAKTLIEGNLPVVLPLYSPRSARLIAEQVSGTGEDLHAIAMSAAVEEAWKAATGRDAEIVPEPTGEAMHARIAAALRL